MNGVRKAGTSGSLRYRYCFSGYWYFPYFGWIIGAGPVPGTPGMFWKMCANNGKATILYVKSSFRKKQKTFIQRL